MSKIEGDFEELIDEAGLDDIGMMIMKIFETPEGLRDNLNYETVAQLFSVESFKELNENNEDFEWEDELDNISVYKACLYDWVFNSLRDGRDRELFKICDKLGLNENTCFDIAHGYGQYGDPELRAYCEEIYKIGFRDVPLVKMLLGFETSRKAAFASIDFIERFLKDDDRLFKGQEDEGEYEMVKVEANHDRVDFMVGEFKKIQKSLVPKNMMCAWEKKQNLYVNMNRFLRNTKDLISRADEYDTDEVDNKLKINHEMWEGRVKTEPEDPVGELRKYEQKIYEDYEALSVYEMDEQELKDKFRKLGILRTFSMEDIDGRVFVEEVGSLEQLVQEPKFHLKDVDKGPYYKIPYNNVGFSSEEAVREFIDSARKFGFCCDRYTYNDPRKLQFKGIFDMRSEWEKVDRERSKTPANYIDGRCYKHLEKMLNLDVTSLKLTENALKDIINLKNLEGSEFTSKLIELENKYGYLFEYGNIYLGDTFMFLGRISDEKEHTTKELKRRNLWMLRSRLRTEEELRFYEPNTIQIEIIEKKELYVNYDLHMKNMKVFNKVTTQYEVFGKDGDVEEEEERVKKLPYENKVEKAKVYRSFKHRVEGSNKYWHIVEQDMVMMYLGDLLTLPCNMDLFRAEGWVTEDVLKLKNKIWKDFDERTGGTIMSHVQDDLKVYTEEEINKMKEKIKSSFLELFEQKIRDFEKIDSWRDDKKRMYLEWHQILDGMRKMEKVFEEILEWQGTLSKEYPPEWEAWNTLKSTDKTMYELLTITTRKLKPLIRSRNKDFDPDYQRRCAEDDRENAIYEEIVLKFLLIWHRVPENTRTDNATKESGHDKSYYDFMFAKQCWVKKDRFNEIKRLMNEEVNKSLRKLEWEDVPAKYEQVVKDYENAIKENKEFDMKFRVNELMKKISNQLVFEAEYSKDLAYRICVIKHFDVSSDSFICIKAPDIEQVKSFCEFYRVYKSIWEEALVPKSLHFEYHLTDIRDTHFSKNYKEKQMFREFSLYLFNLKLHKFSQEYMSKVVYFTDEDEEKIKLNSEDCRNKLIKILDTFEKLQEKNKAKKRVEKVMTGHEYDSVASRARWLCQNRDEMHYRDAMEIRLKKYRKELDLDMFTYREVFDQIMVRNPIRNLSYSSRTQEATPIEYALSLYYLADQNLRRVMAIAFYQGNTPLPFVYPNSQCIIAPFSAINVLSQNTDGQTLPMNPYYKPCLKLCYFQTREMNQKVERMMNQTYFYGGHFYFEMQKNPNALEYGTVFAGICTSNQDEIMNNVSPYNIGLMQNKYFTGITKNENFMLHLSSCVVLLREKRDIDKFKILYNYVKKHNENPKNKGKEKILVDMIWEETYKEVQTTLDPTVHEKWYSRVYFGNLGDIDNCLITDPLMQAKYTEGFFHNLTSLEEDVKNSQDLGIIFDASEEPLKNIIQKAKDLVDNLDVNHDGKILKLQDSLYKRYYENQENLMDSDITLNVESHNKMFRDNMNRVRLEQLEYISELDEDSPVMKVMLELFSLNEKDRFTFLSYLENYLDYKQIKDIFQVDYVNHLQVNNFFREMSQIYEITAEFIGYFEEDEEISKMNPLSKISLLPTLFSNLFWNYYPVELINGDLTVIPIKWLDALFTEITSHPRNIIIDKNGNKTKAMVKVATVVGSQNSGKTTFLNSCFNFNFDVSNGRTTRGSKMVVLPVAPEEFKKFRRKEIEYDMNNRLMTKEEGERLLALDKTIKIPEYMIIIDTEGLGGIDKYTEFVKLGKGDDMNIRDNRMVLFNSGISQLTIVNSMKEFSERIVNVLTMLMYSYARMMDLDVVPKMNLVFQDRDYNQERYNHLWKTVINTLMYLHRNAQRHNRKLPDFYQLLRFNKIKEKDIKMISNFGYGYKFNEDYMRNIQEFKDLTFSRDFLFCHDEKPENFTLNKMHKKIKMLHRFITFERENFNAEKLEELQQKRQHRHFLIKFKRGILKMFRERFPKFNITDTKTLEQNEMNLKQDIIKLGKKDSTDYDCLLNYYKRAKDNGFLGYYEDEKSDKFMKVVDKMFIKLKDLMNNKDQIGKIFENEKIPDYCNQVREELLNSLKEEARKLKSCNNPEKIVEEMGAHFTEKFKDAFEKIEKKNKEVKEPVLKKNFKIKEQIVEILTDTRKSEMEQFINQNVKDCIESSGDKDKLNLMISELISQSNFEDFPNFFSEKALKVKKANEIDASIRTSHEKGSEDWTLRQEHQFLIKKINEQLLPNKIFKNQRIEFGNLRDLITNILKNLDKKIVFQNQWNLGELSEDNLKTLTQNKSNNEEKTDQNDSKSAPKPEIKNGRMNFYCAHLVYYCIFVLVKNVERKISMFVSQFSLGREFLEEHRMPIFFEVVEEFDDDMDRLYLLLGEEFRYRLEVYLNDGYRKIIDEEMPTSVKLNIFVNKEMIKFLEESKQLDQNDESQRIELLEKVMKFGTHFIEYLKDKIEDIIEDNLNKNKKIFVERKKRTHDELYSIGNAIEDETENKKIYSNLIEMFNFDKIAEYLRKNMKSPTFLSLSGKDELKNKILDFQNWNFLKGQLPDQAEVTISEQLKQEYLTLDFSQNSCLGCKMPSTESSTDGTEHNQNYLFHVPPIFNGNDEHISPHCRRGAEKGSELDNDNKTNFDYLQNIFWNWIEWKYEEDIRNMVGLTMEHYREYSKNKIIENLQNRIEKIDLDNSIDGEEKDKKIQYIKNKPIFLLSKLTENDIIATLK